MEVLEKAYINAGGSETKEDPFHRAANQVDGAMSILTGVAANKSIASGLPVKIDSLINF